ncbi:MAG: DUF4097 domain-containing protein [Acidobacteriota bacterium]|nr:DUF4097 domain-containing protein [Acidobacteriota bacterium]
MNFRIFALATCFAFATSAAYASDATFDRTLNVSSSPNISVTTGSGYIHLRPGSDNQVHVVGHVHANQVWFGGGRDNRVQQIVDSPPIVQNGSDITVGERHNDLFRNISIDYDITLPRPSSITAVTGSGDLDAEDVGASIKAQTGSGSVHVHGIRGPATLGTGSGDVDLEQSGPGDVKAETGSGTIRLRGVSGGLRASTGSGDIEIEGNPTSDWRISTGSGSIRLGVGSARFNVDVDTGSGSINVVQPLTMQGSLNRHHIQGIVNGGGPTIRANTGSGDIQIK